MRYVDLLQVSRRDFARAFGTHTVPSSKTAAIVVPRTPFAPAVALMLHWSMVWANAEPAVIIAAREATFDLAARHRSERGLFSRLDDLTLEPHRKDGSELTPEQCRVFWDGLMRSAIHLDSAGAVPSSLDLALESVDEALAELPGRVVGAVSSGLFWAAAAGLAGLAAAVFLLSSSRGGAK